MKIFYHPRFRRSYSYLPENIKKKTERRESIFRKNVFDSRLNTHKLHGKLQEIWSFSVDNKFRIIFEFYDSDVVFLDIGDHGLYK